MFSPRFLAWLLCLVSSPRFLAWLFSPAFKDNKDISSFSTFLRLLLSFFDIPRILSRFSESLGALRIPSLVSAPLFFFSFQSLLALSAFLRWSLCLFSLSLFSFFFLFSFTQSQSQSHLLFLISISSLLFSSSLSHLTFPAYFRYSLRLFSLFRASWCSLHSFAGLLVPWHSPHSFAALPLSSDGF